MSFLEKLLDGVEVVWQPLGEVANVLRGRRLTKDQLSEENKFPVFHGGLEPLGYYEQKNRPAHSVMIINVGASAGTVGYSDVDFWSSDGCYCIDHSESLNNKFLYYFLIGEQHFLQSRVRKAGIPTLDALVIEKLQIPVPCPENQKKSLEIQQKIVAILDKFTELTAELTARKQQYEYYRERLLSFGDTEVEWKMLSEVAELIRGNGLPKSDFTQTGVPAIHYGQIYTYYKTFTTETKSFVSIETAAKLKKVDNGDIVITNTSENLEDVGKAVVYFGKEQAVTGGHATIIKPSKEILGKYIAYFTQTEGFASQKRKFAKGTKVIDVSTSDMAKIKIPIPSPEEQKRIVTMYRPKKSLHFFI